MRGRNGFARGVIAFALLGAAAPAPAESADPQTREIMAEIVEALATVLPLSLSEERWADPAQHETIDAALRKLRSYASALQAHGAGRESSFEFLSGTLAHDTEEIQTRFADGRIGQSRFLLHHLTETCIACHARLPDDRERSLGEQITADPAIAALPVEDRVQLEVATRQFDRALASYEALFANTETSLAEIDLTGHFESYLEVCLRVKEDPQRALAQFERLLAREDLPQRLRRRMQRWVESLRALEDSDAPPLARARELMGADFETRTSDDDELVGLIAASGVIQRALAEGRIADADLGEAYYLLGVIESRVGRSFWASQTEHFLETAIRVGPGQPYAEAAFDLLEELLVSGFSGSGGTHIPPDLVDRMAELQRLIDAAHGS